MEATEKDDRYERQAPWKVHTGAWKAPSRSVRFSDPLEVGPVATAEEDRQYEDQVSSGLHGVRDPVEKDEPIVAPNSDGEASSVVDVGKPRMRYNGVRGLVPAGYISLELDVQRCMEQLRSKQSLLEKSLYLQSIRDANERLYFAILVSHTAEVMPIVYKPTVGIACEQFSSAYRGPLRGIYLSLDDVGMIRELLDNWPESKVTTIVVTDGEMPSGYSDLGVNAMGIAVGKLALYTACAGIDPARVLPVHLDAGTGTKAYLDDPYYLGLKKKRERGPAYDALVKEFIEAAQEKFGPDVLIQFEGMGSLNEFRLLKEWQNKACTFNDDVQGQAAVVLAGLLASGALTGKDLSKHTYLFWGSPEAGTGFVDLLAYAISTTTGVSIETAQNKIFLMDSKGLITKARLLQTMKKRKKGKHTFDKDCPTTMDLVNLLHKAKYAHDFAEECPNLITAICHIKPTVLIGASAESETFTQPICQFLAALNEKPIICTLNERPWKAECTAQEAYEWTNGKAIFITASPSPPVKLENGRKLLSGQANNAYIFPGLGLGVLAAGSIRITKHDMLVAACTLAEQVSEKELEMGSLYPPLERIRQVSAKIATEVALHAHARGIATKPMPLDMQSHVESLMYDPFADR